MKVVAIFIRRKLHEIISRRTGNCLKFFTKGSELFWTHKWPLINFFPPFRLTTFFFPSHPFTALISLPDLRCIKRDGSGISLVNVYVCMYVYICVCMCSSLLPCTHTHIYSSSISHERTILQEKLYASPVTTSHHLNVTVTL